MTKFSEIYTIFLSKIEDYSYSEMYEEDLSELLRGFLMSAVSQFKSVCRKDLTNIIKGHEDGEDFFAEELDDDEIEILALFMVVAHMDMNIVTEDNLTNFLNSRDYRQYSSANLIHRTKDIRLMYKHDAELAMISYDNYHFKRDYLGKGKKT